MANDGNTAGKRATRRNHNSRGARRAAQRLGYETPEEVSWCLYNPKRVAMFFTPYEWAVLHAVWGGWSGYKPPVGRTMREALKAAEARAWEMYYAWLPAVTRWHEGRETDYDKVVLRKYRKPRKGRPGSVDKIPTIEVGNAAPEVVPWALKENTRLTNPLTDSVDADVDGDRPDDDDLGLTRGDE